MIINNKLPHAISEKFNQIFQLAKQQEKQIVFFLDYDGTLSPIVERPELAILTNETRNAVENLSQHFLTSIISGRKLLDVKEKVNLENLFYAGSHGFDIQGNCKILKKYNLQYDESLDLIKRNDLINDEVFKICFAEEFIPILEQVFFELKEKLENINGCILENNKFSLSVHYRLIPNEEIIKEIENVIVTTLQKTQDKTKLTHGKKVFEIRANYDWHKGKAVLELLKLWNLKENHSVLGIYIGDDKTDEDAFESLAKSNLGFGILVANEEDERIYYSKEEQQEQNNNDAINNNNGTTTNNNNNGDDNKNCLHNNYHSTSSSGNNNAVVVEKDNKEKTYAKFYLRNTNEVVSFINHVIDLENKK
ncbi:hypothetical protein ABK040_013155 [Willaertia magna]